MYMSMFLAATAMDRYGLAYYAAILVIISHLLHQLHYHYWIHSGLVALSTTTLSITIKMRHSAILTISITIKTGHSAIMAISIKISKCDTQHYS